MGTNRYPNSIPKFNLYVKNTLEYAFAGNEPRALVWGLSQAEVQKFLSFCERWNDVYISYADEQFGRTKGVILDLNQKIIEFGVLNKTTCFLDRVAACPDVTETELLTMNVKRRSGGSAGRVPSTSITALVLPSFQVLGGGYLRIRCGNNVDSRVHIIKGATGIECRYWIGSIVPNSPDDDGMKIEMSTRARFVLKVGAQCHGQSIHACFRFINAHNKHLSGPWSMIKKVMVL